MTKKKKTYLLLIVVLGIWGTIGYQIFSKLNPEDAPIVVMNSDISFSPKQTTKKDTFQINTKHRDPFLGKPYQANQKKTAKSTSSVKKETIIFPSIIYKGVISKQESAQNIYIIEISGIQQLYKVGKTIADVKLIKGTKKSITISFKRKRKTILVSK